jgi:hypothetical protein
MKYERRKNVSFSNKFHYLSRAIDIMDVHKNTKFKTDLVGLACQISSQPKLKHEDFNGMLDMTILDVAEKLNIE